MEGSKMNKQEILDWVSHLSLQEQRNLTYEQVKNIMSNLSTDEIIMWSNRIGYPVFTRLCMGDLKHKFVLLQDGAAAIIVNEKGQILLQNRSDRDNWGLPGGCQELGERFEDTVIREVHEETNLEVREEDLQLIGVISGASRRNMYPNGDVVINNTVLYCVKHYSGELKWDLESKEMRFFDLKDLPQNQNDPDLIKAYIDFIHKTNSSDKKD